MRAGRPLSSAQADFAQPAFDGRDRAIVSEVVPGALESPIACELASKIRRIEPRAQIGIFDRCEECLSIERQEEALIEQLEMSNAIVKRRDDADPRAVLGLSGDLPGYSEMF